MRNNWICLVSVLLIGLISANLLLFNSSVHAAEYPLVYKDALGREIKIVKKPERIVALSPALTEILWAIGAGGSQIGRTDFCNYPPEARRIKSVGGVVNFSIEQIAALKPDLVIVQRMTPREAVSKLISLKIQVIAVGEPDSLSEVIKLIEDAGEICGERQSAERLASELLLKLDAAQMRLGQSGSTKIRVYYGGFSAPYVTAGAGTFIDDLIRLSGGENIANPGAKGQKGWPQLSPEEIAVSNPQVILASCVETMGNAARPKSLIREAKRNPLFAKTDAVKNGRICIIDADVLQRPGPRIFDALETFTDYLDQVQGGR